MSVLKRAGRAKTGSNPVWQSTSCQTTSWSRLWWRIFKTYINNIRLGSSACFFSCLYIFIQRAPETLARLISSLLTLLKEKYQLMRSLFLICSVQHFIKSFLQISTNFRTALFQEDKKICFSQRKVTVVPFFTFPEPKLRVINAETELTDYASRPRGYINLIHI